MMKKLVSCVVCAVLAVTLFSGCGVERVRRSDGKLSIVTTAFPPYDFVRAVTGDTADITMLICPGAEAHSYEPAPLDILKIQECDVFVCIGGEGEVWADKILGSVDTSEMTVIRLFDYVDPLPEEEVEGASPNGHQHHHDDGDDHDHDSDEYDEHIWTSPRNAVKCVEGIAASLGEAFSERAEEYMKNCGEYVSELEKLDRDFTEMAENAPNSMIVIGDRFPFRYLTADYGLEYSAAFSGCSSESEPGVYTMAYLIEEIKFHGIDRVFYLEFSTKKLAEKLCSATGASMLPLHSCHNVTADEFKSGVTYIDLMCQNLTNLREALY